MVKTGGKKKKTAALLAAGIGAAAVLFLLRPLFKPDEPGPPSPPPIEEKVGDKRTIEDEKVPAPAVKPQDVETTIAKSAAVKPTTAARIAVIIDDVGYESDTMNEFSRFEGKLTFSVLPFMTHSREYAEILYDRGFEIMLHIPMEPLDYPDHDPGEGALYTWDRREDVLAKLDTMVSDTPHIRGANNHMGSKATGDEELMGWTLSYLKSRDLYFIDSFTTADSVAYEKAVNMAMKTGRRDIFLDNENNFSSINGQFEKLKAIALEEGSAVAIGHFQNENTVKVLNHQLPMLRNEGIELVFASELVRVTRE